MVEEDAEIGRFKQTFVQDQAQGGQEVQSADGTIFTPTDGEHFGCLEDIGMGDSLRWRPDKGIAFGKHGPFGFIRMFGKDGFRGKTASTGHQAVAPGLWDGKDEIRQVTDGLAEQGDVEIRTRTRVEILRPR